MAKVLYIGRCYNQPPIRLTKGMSLKELAHALQALQGHEVTKISLVKERPQRDPWQDEDDR